MEKIKKSKTVLLALLLSVSMVFSSITVPQAKTKPRTGQDANGNTWEYDRKTKTLTFSGTKDLEAFIMDGHIPEPEWWCWYDEARHLVIDPGITGLPEGEFSDFYKLKTIDLPDTVTYIGNDVFDGCRQLEAVKMSENISFIGNGAFNGCTSLKNIQLPEKVTHIGRAAFCGCENIKEIDVPDKVTQIADTAFANCKNLESVRLPENLKVISESLFFGCKKLSEVWLPDSVEKIKEDVFQNSGIVRVEIPEKVTGFYEGDGLFKSYYGVFEDCRMLKEVVIRSRKLKTCYQKTFKGLDKNTVIKVPKGCLKKYKKMFQKAGLDKKIRMETWDGKEKPLSGTEKYGTSWTYSRETRTLEISGTADFGKYLSGMEPGWNIYYNEAEHIIVRDGITGRLPDGCFRLFYRLRTAELSDTVESIGDDAFYGCKNLKTVRLPGNTASIGSRAFMDCYRLREVQIPDTVTSVKKRAFYGCEALQEIHLPDSVETIGSYAFSGCSRLAAASLPEALEVLEEGVFYYCESLREVKLPVTLKKIKKNVFSKSGITHIEIPKNVTGFYEDKKSRIWDGVFSYCSNLKEITIKSKKLDHIYEGSWMGVKKQTVIKVPKSCLKKYKKAFRKAGLDEKVKVKAISGKKKFSPVTFSGEKYRTTLKEVVDNASNSKVQGVIDGWKK